MMPKKKRQESQEEQSKRFRAAVRQMIADGELNPIDAEQALDKLTKRAQQGPN